MTNNYQSMKVFLRNLFKSKDSRSAMLRNNILLSAVMKAFILATSFLIVPVTLGFLDKEQYGIWMTLSSILLWFSFFDVGLGNGMRNYLAQAFAEGDFRKGRIFLTTTLAMLTVIATGLALFFLTFVFYADLGKVFNTEVLTTEQLRLPILIAIIMTILMFVVKNIGVVYIALQRYAVNELINASANTVALICIFLCTRIIPAGNLTAVVLIFTSLPVIAFIIAAIPLFRQYPQLIPSMDCLDWKYGKILLSKGIGFFFIQITSCLVIFGGSNLFITQFEGPQSVTTYNIAYKYFNLLTIAYTIIVSPMWNAYTEAHVKGDYLWIKLNFFRSLGLWTVTVLGGFLMLYASNLFYEIWVGDTVRIPFTVSLAVLGYVTFFNLNNCVTMLINGLNKIHVQIITSIVITIIFLFCVISWGPQLGIEGIVFCMAGSYAVMSFIHLFQCYLLINQKATGIWNQ